MPIDRARLKHREWENQIDARIINIRAARKGDGQTLTPKQAGRNQANGIAGLRKAT